MKIKNILFHGRFQPPHAGHVGVIEHFLQKYPDAKITVSIDVREPDGSKNPFGLLERLTRFNKLLSVDSALLDRVLVETHVPWDLTPNGCMMSLYDIYGTPDLVIGGSDMTEVVREFWGELNVPVETIPRIGGISGTKIRAETMPQKPLYGSIVETYPIPTGYLFVGEYSKGKLETLSIGDYGKHHNVKADFLGYSDIIQGVPNTYCMPLSEKWVVTLSTQFGCQMACTFCDCPNVEWHGNVSFDDLKAQLYNALSLFPKVKYTERLNIHFARMGEPIFNSAVFEFSRWLIMNKRQIESDTGLRIEVIHPVLTTSLPRKYKALERKILEWCAIKNTLYNGQAGLQFSINSTNEDQRTEMFGGLSLTLEELSEIGKKMPDPVSRKYCLNFAYSTGFEIDGDKIRQLFDPKKFMCKITPIHNNTACKVNGIETIDGYTSWQPYQKPEEALKQAGFDVLVFVPSMDEEDGLVTCGNAILGGSTMKNSDSIIKIRGL